MRKILAVIVLSGAGAAAQVNSPSVARYIDVPPVGSCTYAPIIPIIKSTGAMCLRCGAADVKLTADHVIPVCKGGSSDISNIQPLCKPCNSSKHKKTTDYRCANG